MRCNLVRTVTVAVSSLLKTDANVWVDGAVSSYYRETYAEAEQRLGEVRALRLAGHNNIFPTLHGSTALPRSASGIRAALIKLKRGRSVLLTKPPPMKLKPLLKTAPDLVLLVLLVFSSRMTRRTGVKSRNCLKATAPATANCVWKWGLVRQKRRDDGIPGITNDIFSRNCRSRNVPTLGRSPE